MDFEPIDKKQLQQLKEENQLLKQLITELPFSFLYQNARLGYKVNKEKGFTPPTITKQTKEKAFPRDEFIITSTFDKFEETEAFLTKILDLVPHHIVFVDHNGIITLCNQKAATDLEVNRDDIIGKHIRELLHLPDEEIAVIDTIRTGRELVDKEVLDVNYGILNTRILWNPDGSIKRVIGTFYFLNVVKEAEKQALAGRIAAGIAHEVRNPLTTVRGYLQYFQDKVDDDISELFTTLLIPEIDRANKIISDFLCIAKPAQTKFETIYIKEFLTEYLGIFLKSEALLHNVEITFSIDPETDHVSIQGDREELLQVFLNLFQNSLQAKPEGTYLKVKIGASLVNSNVCITFVDNGNGIHPSILAHVFDPFFTTKDEGTGLGLSVSRKIIENHKGTMTAASNKEGTTFKVELPVKPYKLYK